jgi:hypothetical protein
MTSPIRGADLDGVETRLSLPFTTWYCGWRSLASRIRVRMSGATIVAVIIAAAAVLAWLSVLDFPLGTHPDEPAKVRAVLRGPGADFHPILMIQLVRLANAFLQWTDPQSVVQLGRTFAALFGGALIVCTFLLARTVLPGSVSAAVAAATLATPLISVHARYFKEDIFVAPFVILALFALIGLLRRPTIWSIFSLGAFIGLAGASKYVGGLLLVIYAPLVIALGARERLGMRLVTAGLVVLIAAATFVAIDLPAIFTSPQFRTNVHLEYVHAANGHGDIVLPITVTLGLFHLRESLWPGLGHILTVLSVLGLAAPYVALPERRGPLAVIVGFALLWYFAHEISPLKPYPDFARYMVPLAPMLLVLSAAFVYEWIERILAGAGAEFTGVTLLCAALPAAASSLQINARASDDPRWLLPKIVATAPGPVAVDSYATYAQVPSLAGHVTGLSATTTPTVVTSSFNYERYEQNGTLDAESERTHAAARFFAKMFEMPHLDVSNGRPAFGFFNPEITIVALNSQPWQLASIAKVIASADPKLHIRWSGTAGTNAVSK